MFKLKDVLNNKGATLNKAGEAVNYKGGYQVSLKDMEVISVKNLRKAHLINLLDGLADGLYLGIWIDNGKAYIDQSKRIATKKQAVKIGKEYKQISIWNWNKKEAVYL